jgi:hypothetical protein
VDMSAIDPEYMSSLFLELPGIDPNDPDVQVRRWLGMGFRFILFSFIFVTLYVHSVMCGWFCLFGLIC